MAFVFRAAKLEEHKALLQISKQSKYTKDFSNQLMFSSPAAYEKGWIRVVEQYDAAYGLVGIQGFTCVRVKSRVQEVVLYFVGVDHKSQRSGLGIKLIEDFMDEAPRTHRLLRLNVMKDNEQAVAFYMKHGFEVAGTALKGAGIQLTRTFPEPIS